jgi:hypothetical protein
MKFKVELIIDVSDRQLEDGHINDWPWNDVIGLGSDAVVLHSEVKEIKEDEV